MTGKGRQGERGRGAKRSWLRQECTVGSNIISAPTIVQRLYTRQDDEVELRPHILPTLLARGGERSTLGHTRASAQESF